jgi:hypothetical protein
MQFRLRNSQPIKVVERTSISFNREDLAALTRLVQAGQVLLADEPRPPVIARLKAAMTRLGLQVPNGL